MTTTPPATERLDETDLLRLQLARARLENAALHHAGAKANNELQERAVMAKYRLGDCDAVDINTGVITRDARPAADGGKT